MENNTLANHIVYHKKKPKVDCPDGIISAAIAGLDLENPIYWGDCYRDSEAYEKTPTPSEAYPFEDGDRLIIVDFSYPARWLWYWEAVGVKLTVIDHHAPKFPMLRNFSGAILNETECGATLTWRYIFGDRPMPEWLIHVKRRDIGADGYYKGNCPESERFTEGLSLVRSILKKQGGSENVIRFLQRLISNQVDALEVHAILNETNYLGDDPIEIIGFVGQGEIEKRDKLVDEAMKRARIVYLKEYLCAYVETYPHEDRVGSQLGHKLAKINNVMFGWVKNSDGRSELRGNGYMDLGKFADEELGGGGHFNAAGFTRAIEPVEPAHHL